MSGLAKVTFLAADQRVDGDRLAGVGSVQRRADGLVPKDQRRYTAGILAMPGMHVRPANTAECQINKRFSRCRNRGVGVAYFAGLRAGIEQCFHFAVNPPSTIRICPVT